MTDKLQRRKRLRRWERAGDARFLTFSCYGRLPLLGTPPIRDVLVNTIAAVRARDEARFDLYAWVVMPEHVHMLLKPAPGVEWSVIASAIKISVARRVLARWRELAAPVLNRLATRDGRHRFWQHGGGFDRNVRHMSEFCETVRYIHHNPVERGLVTAAHEWRWSSARHWMGVSDPELPCNPPPGDPGSWAMWKGYV